MDVINKNTFHIMESESSSEFGSGWEDDYQTFCKGDLIEGVTKIVTADIRDESSSISDDDGYETDDDSSRNSGTFNEVTKILTADMWSSKVHYWPLIEQDGKSTVDVGVAYSNYCDFDIHKRFPFLQMILDKYKGEMCAAGGAVANHLFTPHTGNNRVRDVDLFFYGISEDRANVILKDCVAMLCCATDYVGYEYQPKTTTDEPYRQVRVERNIKYVNVSFTKIRNTKRYHNDVVNTYQECIIYQFILRIYPTFDSVIGGFDIPVSSFAYDGDKFYGTEIADWCIKHKILIANIKRRSPSFEHRLIKYCHRFNLTLFFPGLDMDELSKSKSKASFKKLREEIREVVKRNNFAVVNDGDGNDENWYNNSLKEAMSKMDWPIFRRIVFAPAPTKPFISSRLDPDLMKMSKERVERISDYSHTPVHNGKIGRVNSSACSANNPDAVIVCVTYTTTPKYEAVLKTLDDMIENPKIRILDKVDLKIDCEARCERVKRYNVRNGIGCNIKIIGIPNLDEYIDLNAVGHPGRDGTFEHSKNVIYRRMKLVHNASLETAKKNLKGLRWITKNPSVQWTSSHHPIHASAAEYYGEFHKRFEVGIPWPVAKVLLLGRKERTSILWTLSSDMFKYIMIQLLRLYAN
jgi:hypothetical protein